MTRTIQMCSEFTGTDDQVLELDFGSDVTIREKGYNGQPGKYLSLSHEDFERIVAEYDSFKRLNQQAHEAA